MIVCLVKHLYSFNAEITRQVIIIFSFGLLLESEVVQRQDLIDLAVIIMKTFSAVLGLRILLFDFYNKLKIITSHKELNK